LNWQGTESIHSHLNAIQAELKQMHKIVEDGKHIAQGVVTAAADVNSVIERVFGVDLDGDGQVRQQPMRKCRSWHYFCSCVDKLRGGVACRPEKAQSWSEAVATFSDPSGTDLE
jgi:hypothetical protein